MTLVASSPKPLHRQVVGPPDQPRVQAGCQACGDQVKAPPPGMANLLHYGEPCG
jgi:hypothetical protein